MGNNHHFCDVPICSALVWKVYSRFSSCYGNNVGELSFVGLFVLHVYLGYGSLWQRFTLMRLFLVSLFSLHILIQSASFNRLFDGILQLHTVVSVVSVDLMELIIFWLVRLRCIFDEKMGSDSCLPKKFVHIILIDSPIRDRQWDVTVILFLHVSVRIIPIPVRLFPIQVGRVRLARCGVIKACGQFLFQNRKRFDHGQHLLDGFHLPVP